MSNVYCEKMCFSYSESNIASISHLKLEYHWYPCWEEHIETHFIEAHQEKKDILNCAKEVILERNILFSSCYFNK